MSRRFIVAIVALVLVAAACGGGERELVGYAIEPAPQVDVVALPDVSQGGEPFELRARPGGLLVVYFGYTNCPDVCPTTMSDLRAARRQLGDDTERVDVAMVTIDPDRDTDLLAGYVDSFVEGGHALATSDAADLRAVADRFGVTYLVETNASGEIEVAHSPQLYVVDDTGQLALTWQFGVTPDDLAGDLQQLLESA
ncbi:MAG: SCO family protein [Ilumatobacteraceae bacterium]